MNVTRTDCTLNTTGEVNSKQKSFYGDIHNISFNSRVLNSFQVLKLSRIYLRASLFMKTAWVTKVSLKLVIYSG